MKQVVIHFRASEGTRPWKLAYQLGKKTRTAERKADDTSFGPTFRFKVPNSTRKVPIQFLAGKKKTEKYPRKPYTLVLNRGLTERYYVNGDLAGDGTTPRALPTADFEMRGYKNVSGRLDSLDQSVKDVARSSRRLVSSLAVRPQAINVKGTRKLLASMHKPVDLLVGKTNRATGNFQRAADVQLPLPTDQLPVAGQQPARSPLEGIFADLLAIQGGTDAVQRRISELEAHPNQVGPDALRTEFTNRLNDIDKRLTALADPLRKDFDSPRPRATKALVGQIDGPIRDALRTALKASRT
jgi:hypothetical protein